MARNGKRLKKTDNKKNHKKSKVQKSQVSTANKVNPLDNKNKNNGIGTKRRIELRRSTDESYVSCSYDGCYHDCTDLPPSSQYVSLDVEHVHVGKTQHLGRCSIVDSEGRVLLDVYSRPQDRKLNPKSWKGIHAKDAKHALPYPYVRYLAKEILKDHILVGHGIHGDLETLNLHHPAHSIRDTSLYVPLRSLAGLKLDTPPKRSTLSFNILGRRIQEVEHCSVDDAQATMALFMVVRAEWESTLLSEASNHKKDSTCAKPCSSWTFGKSSSINTVNGLFNKTCTIRRSSQTNGVSVSDTIDDDESGQGYNSDDERHQMENDSDDTMESWYEYRLKLKKGYAVKWMKGDGACLYRAVDDIISGTPIQHKRLNQHHQHQKADQLFGDEEKHGVVRNSCCDYMEKKKDFFSQFVTENFAQYLARKRLDDCQGNHLEIQAVSDLYGRPVEIYEARRSDDCHDLNTVNRVALSADQLDKHRDRSVQEGVTSSAGAKLKAALESARAALVAARTTYDAIAAAAAELEIPCSDGYNSTGMLKSLIQRDSCSETTPNHEIVQTGDGHVAEALPDQSESHVECSGNLKRSAEENNKEEPSIKMRKATCQMVLRSQNVSSLQATGLLAEEEKYQFLREQEGKLVLAKKKGSGAITCQASKSSESTRAECTEVKEGRGGEVNSEEEFGQEQTE